MTTRYEATREDIIGLLTEWDEPRYRADQAWDALYRQRKPLEEATALSAALRARSRTLPSASLDVAEQSADDGTTHKWLWACADGAQIETVLMRSPTRATVCVSSQAGCAMGCTFCATGQAGFERHLDVGEIVEQVARAAHAATTRVTNVVFMGMGEPLANYDATWAAIQRIHDDLGISARRITVSTVGVVPGIRRLADDGLPVTLAVSLHAARRRAAQRARPPEPPLPDRRCARRRRGVRRGARPAGHVRVRVHRGRERLTPARRGPRLLGAFHGVGGAHVNLIPLNATAGYAGAAPVRPRLLEMAERLRRHGVTATVRRNRGADIAAACGQLPGPPLHRPQWARTSEVVNPSSRDAPGAACYRRRRLRSEHATPHPALITSLAWQSSTRRRGRRSPVGLQRSC